MASNVSLFVRYVNDPSRMFVIRVNPELTIGGFKYLISLLFNVPVSQQLLAQSGHIGRYLQDDRTIGSYGLQDGHAVYVVRRFVPPTSSSASVAVAAPVGGTSTRNILSGDGSVHSQGFGGGNAASLSPSLDGSSDGTIPDILIKVQYSSETRFGIQVRPELTVGEFKGLICQLQNIPVNEQRLIYSGQFLQDDKAIGSYGVQDGHVIHLARRIVPATSSASASVATTAVPSFQPQQQQMYRELQRMREMMRNIGRFNANPLPNRWGINSAGAIVPGFAVFGIPRPSGLDLQSSGAIDPATRIQAQQNPDIFQIRDEVIYADPQSSGMVDANPHVLEALQNPETSTSQLASRGRLQQSMAYLSPPLGSTPRRTGQTAEGAAGMFVRLEEQYANQLFELREMGFFDTRANLLALHITGGNLRFAVQLLDDGLNE